MSAQMCADRTFGTPGGHMGEQTGLEQPEAEEAPNGGSRPMAGCRGCAGVRARTGTFEVAQLPSARGGPLGSAAWSV